jgi:thiol peroxidase
MIKVTFAGDSLTLPDNQLSIDDTFPDFSLTDNDLGPFTLSDTSGLRLFLTVPSLDTGVCDLEVRTFNQKASQLPDVSIYVVSCDLPFAQGRWCGSSGVTNLKTLSDYKDHNFGKLTGTYIEELALLSRAAFIVDTYGKVSYIQYVSEITNPPDYEDIYNNLLSIA